MSKFNPDQGRRRHSLTPHECLFKHNVNGPFTVTGLKEGDALMQPQIECCRSPGTAEESRQVHSKFQSSTCDNERQ